MCGVEIGSKEMRRGEGVLGIVYWCVCWNVCNVRGRESDSKSSKV